MIITTLLVLLIVLGGCHCAPSDARSEPAAQRLEIRIDDYDGPDGRIPIEQAPFHLNGVYADHGIFGLRKAFSAVRQLPPGSVVVLNYNIHSNDSGRMFYVDPFSALDRRDDLLDLVKERR